VTTLAAVLRQGVQHAVEHSGSEPRLIAPVAGLIRGIAPWQILPRGAGLEDPQDAVQYVAGVAPGPTASVGATARCGQQGLEHGPLSVGEVHESTPGPRAPEV